MNKRQATFLMLILALTSISACKTTASANKELEKTAYKQIENDRNFEPLEIKAPTEKFKEGTVGHAFSGIIQTLTKQTQESFDIINKINSTCLKKKLNAFDITKGTYIKKYDEAMKQYMICAKIEHATMVRYAWVPFKTMYYKNNGDIITLQEDGSLLLTQKNGQTTKIER